MSPNYRLHFQSDAYEGLAEIEGIMHIQEAHVLLEYQVKDALAGVVKSDLKQLHIPFDEISLVQYKLNFFVSKMIFQIDNMEILGKFEASQKGRIKLKVKRRNKELAKRFASQLKLRISESNLDILDQSYLT